MTRSSRNRERGLSPSIATKDRCAPRVVCSFQLRQRCKPCMLMTIGRPRPLSVAAATALVLVTGSGKLTLVTRSPRRAPQSATTTQRHTIPAVTFSLVLLSLISHIHPRPPRGEKESSITLVRTAARSSNTQGRPRVAAALTRVRVPSLRASTRHDAAAVLAQDIWAGRHRPGDIPCIRVQRYASVYSWVHVGAVAAPADDAVPIADTDDLREVCSGMWGGKEAYIEGG
jgi:hypothetical protein